MPFKFNVDPSTFDALGRLAESFDKYPAGAVLVSVFVIASILACGASIAIARRHLRGRRHVTGTQMP